MARAVPEVKTAEVAGLFKGEEDVGKERRRPEAVRLAESLDESCQLRANNAQLVDFLASVDRTLDLWGDYKNAQHERQRLERSKPDGAGEPMRAKTE